MGNFCVTFTGTPKVTFESHFRFFELFGALGSVGLLQGHKLRAPEVTLHNNHLKSMGDFLIADRGAVMLLENNDLSCNLPNCSKGAHPRLSLVAIGNHWRWPSKELLQILCCDEPEAVFCCNLPLLLKMFSLSRFNRMDRPRLFREVGIKNLLTSKNISVQFWLLRPKSSFRLWFSSFRFGCVRERPKVFQKTSGQTWSSLKGNCCLLWDEFLFTMMHCN